MPAGILGDISLGFEYAKATHQRPQHEVKSNAAPVSTSMTVRGQGRGAIAPIPQAIPKQVPDTNVPATDQQSSLFQAPAMVSSDTKNASIQSANVQSSDALPPPYYAGPAGTDSGVSNMIHNGQICDTSDAQDPRILIQQGEDPRATIWRADRGIFRTNPQHQPQVSERPRQSAARRIRDEQATAISLELQRQQTSPTSIPDFDLDKLMKQDYSALRAQPFDISPSEKRTTLVSNDLDDLMVKHLNSTQGDQNKFFQSLTIDEWEDAGDWLLGRATDIMKRLKKVRREKRRLTLDVEIEMEKRHDAVMKKRKATDEALDAMKKSGGQVLASTPRKRATREQA